jgi:hypothetical protein
MPSELLLHVTPGWRVTAGTTAFAPGLLRPPQGPGKVVGRLVTWGDGGDTPRNGGLQSGHDPQVDHEGS